ncbi:hypothetical protein HPB50_018224 [Hyalomma asiaticum]|uniref:Uncharacterized protein n=1 Tax=Hyalomma asiaticum TaxID=266040 RepID=A0ACB7RK09_HYAAI|nr:hypothetical protein HPB50_018224 [Hyalomma asiaticum]
MKLNAEIARDEGQNNEPKMTTSTSVACQTDEMSETATIPATELPQNSAAVQEVADESDAQFSEVEARSAVHPGPVPPQGEQFAIVNGQVQLGMGLTMSAMKWQFIMKATSDSKFTTDVARHLWPAPEAAQRSLTGQACRTVENAADKIQATPQKVDVVKACLERYVQLNPMEAPAPPPQNRVAAARKYLRSYFTEAGRQGKRVRAKTVK